MFHRTLPAIVAAGLFASTASANLQITEVYSGVSGEDGTADWIEVTNFGAVSIDTGDFYYDDISANVPEGGQLDSFVLAPGETAIFLISLNLTEELVDDVTYANVVEEFLGIWGPVPNVGITNGGGSLGQPADTANILDTGNNVVDSFAYASSGVLATFDDSDGDGTGPLSVVGVNGAYESNVFFNDNLGLPNDEATMIGSPGVVPEPASLALVGLGGLAMLKRRR